MSNADISKILIALQELRDDVEHIKNKRITIEEIGVGSFVGWMKLTATIAVFFVAMAGSGYGILSQVSSLESRYSSHMRYVHKLNPGK